MSFAFTASEKRPLIAIGIQNIGDSLESLPLVMIMAPVKVWIRPLARRFGFNETDRLSCVVSRKIRLANAVLEMMLSGQQNVAADDPAISFKKGLEWSPEFILRLSGAGDLEPGFNGIGEIRESVMKRFVRSFRPIILRCFLD